MKFSIITVANKKFLKVEIGRDIITRKDIFFRGFKIYKFWQIESLKDGNPEPKKKGEYWVLPF